MRYTVGAQHVVPLRIVCTPRNCKLLYEVLSFKNRVPYVLLKRFCVYGNTKSGVENLVFMIHIPGYHLSEKLYNGSRTLVYRAIREIDSLPVVIKLLKNPYPSFSELVQFRNQYTIAKNLNYPGIIQTYSLEPYQNG